MKLTLDALKKSEVLKHIIKTDKVKLSWLETVCVVLEEDLKKLASEYAMVIDEEGYILAPNKAAIIEEINDYITRIEESENITSILEPTFLETEFSPEIVVYVESIFKKEGFDFRQRNYTIRVEENGITIGKKKATLYKYSWNEIKSIHCTTQTKDSYTFDDENGGGIGYVGTGSSAELALLPLFFLIEGSKPPPKAIAVKETIKHNALVLFLENGKHKQINIFNFKLKQQIPIPEHYDYMTIIVEHFFKKMKRM